MKHTKTMIYSPSHTSEDLYLYTVNTGEIYRQYTRPLIETAKKHAKRGNFSFEKFADGFYRITTEAAKMYSREINPFNFSVTARYTAAVEMAKRYEEDVLEG